MHSLTGAERSSGWGRLPERGFGAPNFRAPSGSASAGKLGDDLLKLPLKPARRFRLRLRYPYFGLIGSAVDSN